MALKLNSLVWRASSSIFPTSHRRVVGRQFLGFVGFSTVNQSALVKSVFDKHVSVCNRRYFDEDDGNSDSETVINPEDNEAVPNPGERPLDFVNVRDANILFLRGDIAEHEHTRVEVYGDTYKVVDGTPSVSMYAYVLKTDLQMHLDATAEPERIRIRNIKICENPNYGHLKAYEEHLGTRGINAKTIGILFNCFKKQQPQR